MSTRQRLSLMGLYNYENDFGRDLFDKLELPEGYEKSTFVNALLLEHGEKCVLYTDPSFFTLAIGVWSKKWALELSRIFEALTAEYNPIYNYDRYEESIDGRKKEYKSDVNSGARAESKNESDGNTSTKANNETISKENGTTQTNSTGINSSANEKKEDQEAQRRTIDRPDYEEKTTNDYDVTTSQTTPANVEHQISADNSSTYQPNWKETTDAGVNKTENDGTITREYSGKSQDLEEVAKNGTSAKETALAQEATSASAESSDTFQNVNSGEEIKSSKSTDSTTTEEARTVNTRDKEHENNEHRAHLYGNIGVTTSASMVSEVVQQRMNTNLYGIVTGIFARELLIGIY